MAEGEFEHRGLKVLMELPIGTCVEQAYEVDGGQTEFAFFRANTEFFRCIGYTQEEFAQKGNNLNRIIMRDERKRMEDKKRMAGKHPGVSCSDVFEILQPDGQACMVQWSVRGTIGENGECYLIECCNRFDEIMRKQSMLMDRLNKEKQEKKRLNDLVYELPVGVAVIRGGHDTVIETANAAFLQAKGYALGELIENRSNFKNYIYPADLSRFEEAVENCRDRKTVEEMEVRIICKNGELRWEYMQCQLYYYRNAVPYYILTSWDVNERKQLEDELRLMDEQYRMLEEVSDEFPLEYDVAAKRFRIPQKYYEIGKVTDRNRKYVDAADMFGEIHEEDREKCERAIQAASTKEISGTLDYRLNMAPQGKKPDYVWHRTIYRSILGGNAKINRIIGRSYDISYDRSIQEKLSEEMRLDPLTRLLNKVAVGEEIQEFLDEKPEGTHVLFLIDVDNFKRINDTFGHTVGDTVLTDTAETIGKLFEDNCIVGRIGGDEFLAFMEHTTPELARKKAKELCREAAKTLIGDEAEVNVTLSVGLAVYGIDGEDYETLFAMADRAMYQTKRSGKNSFSFAQKGEPVSSNSTRKEKKTEPGYLRSQEADKDFLNFAFSLLSHAKDVNGSLNVLLEQIGRKYGLDIVAVMEYADEKPEMEQTNSWNRYGKNFCHEVLPRAIAEFKQAMPGEFVVITEESLRKQNPKFWKNWNCEEMKISHIAGTKFEISGNHSGCLYIGVSRKEEGFSRTEEITLCELGRIVAVFVSLRNKIRDDQRKIQNLQNRDKLTGLYNLDAFREKTDEVLRDAAEKGSGRELYALVHVDINNFSYVNENFGQQVGDDILRDFATLIETGENVVEACRMYSDYFIELVIGENEEDIYRRIAKTNKRFEEMQKQKYPASSMHLSAGICFVDDCEKPFETILEGANLARKQAKEQKSSTVVYREDMRERRDDEIHITGRFYGAMQKGELEVFLQPKFLLEDQKIYGAEALARWRLPSGELLSPAKFIPPLESMGYIVDLDFYILEQLLRAMKRWKDAGKQLFTISTNFSRRNFANGGKDFIERLQQTMERYGIKPQYIEIEVTESVIVENLSELKGCLCELEKLGYRIAIDDFGTGYSSLSVLLEIPADVIKIDKTFTDRIDFKEQQNFVSHMGQFIKSAKEEVIFEGIEKQEQRNFLLDCGFRYGQGYLFDKPLSVESFERKYM